VSFRTVKLAAAVIVAGGLIVSLCWPPAHSVFAQLPAQNPLLAPQAAPSAPPQLAAPVTVEAAPSLAALPTPGTPLPTPSVQTFNCSCFGPSTGTAWMGSITTTSYFKAEQAAVGECTSYNERSPAQPAIPSVSTETQGAIPSLPGNAASVNAAGDQAQSLPGVSISNQNAVIACERCACS
jgi:hypothetical protein